MLQDKLLLEKELLAERNKSKSEKDILAEVSAVLEENTRVRSQILNQLNRQGSTKMNQLDIDLLETDKIFHLDQIKTISVAYRLRFLDSSLFKNEIPAEAITKIRLLEQSHQTTLEGFKIMAPSKAFHLINYDDPLLFVPIGNNYYYLIHQWGKEINVWRKIKVLPIKNLLNFTLFTLLISVLFTLVMPINDISITVPLAPVLLFLFTFKSIFAVLAYYFFMLGKNFNEEIWQRKYYNN
jgi:hypothetical protein